MIFVCTILFMVFVLWRLIVRELAPVFGLIVPTSAIRRNYFMAFILLFGVVALFAPPTSWLAADLTAGYSGVDIQNFSLVVISTVVCILLLDHFDLSPSVWLATLGALEAAVTMESLRPFDWPMVVGWFVAPVVAGVLAALIYFVLRKVFVDRHIHLIRLSGYMRYVVIVGFALLALTVGVNSGAMLLLVGRVLLGQTMWVTLGTVVLLVVAMVIFGRALAQRMDEASDSYADSSTQTIVALCYALILTLILFSLPVVESVGLKATPLALSSLLVGGFCGMALFRNHPVEGARLRRMALGVVLTPMLAFFCFYVLWSIFSGSVAAREEVSLSLIIVAVMLVMLMLFGRYVRKQERLHEASRKLIQNQQQELFENQKALNAMELNTILAENHSLHGTLELKRKEIINVALGISEQKEFLEMLSEKVHRAAKSSGEEKDRIIAEVEKELSQRTSFSGEIDEFYTQAEMLHKDFSVKLTEEFPNLTTSERRLATLLRLGFSSKYIATLMNISPKSVEISRYRLRQKLGLKKGDNLINFIKSI